MDDKPIRQKCSSGDPVCTLLANPEPFSARGSACQCLDDERDPALEPTDAGSAPRIPKLILAPFDHVGASMAITAIDPTRLGPQNPA